MLKKPTYEDLKRSVLEQEKKIALIESELRKEIADRKSIEQKNHFLELSLKEYSNISPNIVGKANLKTGYFIEASPMVTEILGYSVEEFLSQPVLEFIHPEDRQITKNEISKQIKGKTVSLFKNRYLCKDGSFKWMVWQGTPADKNGIVMAIGSDITDRKNAEMMLEESKYYFSQIFEQSSTGMCLYNPDGTINKVNKKFCQMFGVEENVILRSGYNVFRDQAVIDAGVIPILKDIFDNKKNREWEINFDIDLASASTRTPTSIKGKIYLEVMGYPILNNDGHLEFVVLQHYNITERKKTEEDLRASNDRFVSAFKSSGVGMAIVNTDGQFVSVNRAASNILGYTEQEMLEKTFPDICHPDDLDDSLAKYNGLLSGEYDNYQLEKRYLHKDGHIIWGILNISIIKDPCGNPLHSIAQLQDITSRKEAEASSIKLTNQLKSLWNITKIADADIKVICDHVLEEVQNLTKSDYAFYGFIDANEREMDLHSWSQNTMDDCKTIQKVLHFSVEEAGLWAEAIRKRKPLVINDFDVEHPAKKGVPDGHVPLTRLLAVPLVRRGKVVTIAAIANKEIDYSEDDVQQIEAFLGNVQILIDRKQIENNLVESEKKWRNILVNTPQIAISLDPQAGIVFANESFLKLTGWRKEEINGQNWFDLFIPVDSRDEMEKVFQEALSSKASIPFLFYENEILTKSGELLSIAWSNVLSKDGNGEIMNITCLGVDLTERVKSEKEIARQKRLFETMFNTIPDGVVITNTEREIQLANTGMIATFGYTPDELVGRKTQILYSTADNFDKAGKQVFQKESKKLGDLYITRYKDKNGREFSGETFGAKLFGENGEWIGNLGIMRDITEREQAELRIQQAQRMESIGNLAGGIAHDFNNILFPIVGMSELLLDDLQPESQEYASVQEIFKAAIRGSELVKQILSFSRQTEHKLIPLRIQQVINEAVSLSRATIPSFIEIDQDIQPDCGFVMADPTQIHQVIMNIITNAYHAVESNGGRIAIRLKETVLKAGELIEMSIKPGRYIILSISDNGHGMPSDLMAKIFEPYFTTKAQGKGTGLGLAVSYGIIKEHKGEIKVDSEVGKGTTFNIYLPLMEKLDVSTKQMTLENSPTGSERILLIDDEESVATTEKKMLERLGYKVDMYVNSFEALEAFKSHSEVFDLVLSDMNMPQMPGNQLALTVKAIRPEIPVIICTGFSEKINEKKAFEMGIQGVLMKPIIKADLAVMIRKVLDDAWDK